MSDGTKIEWTKRPGTIGATMNALVGCQKVSQGCARCYAIGVAHVRAGNPHPKMQEKFSGLTILQGGKLNWTGKVTLTESALLAPLTKRKPHTYFVNALSDLFYEGVPDEWIDRHFAVFALCPQHTFIVLTKRPERQRDYLRNPDTRLRIARRIERWVHDGVALKHLGYREADDHRFQAQRSILYGPLPNVWLGVSAEDQRAADERIPLLLQTPAAVRFVSLEPLLGSMTLKSLVGGTLDALSGIDFEDITALGSSARPSLDWVIVGGESGPGARPMHPDWARALRDQCLAAHVPFFFKQWGEWAPYEPVRDGDYTHKRFMHYDGRVLGPTEPNPDGLDMRDWAGIARCGKKAAGHLLDGQEWQQFPEVRA